MRTDKRDELVIMEGKAKDLRILLTHKDGIISKKPRLLGWIKEDPANSVHHRE